jgi:hypothetical protein
MVVVAVPTYVKAPAMTDERRLVAIRSKAAVLILARRNASGVVAESRVPGTCSGVRRLRYWQFGEQAFKG